MKIQPARLACVVFSHSESGCFWQRWRRGHSHERYLENVLCGKQKYALCDSWRLSSICQQPALLLQNYDVGPRKYVITL